MDNVKNINVNENTIFAKPTGLFIKAFGMTGVVTALKEDLDQVETFPVTASEQMFLDRHAN